MNKGTKILVDIIMTAAMLLLMSLTTTGILWHELLGVGIFLLFFFHKFLNWKWIHSVTKGIFKSSKEKRVNFKTKGMYALNTAILFFVTVATFTGIWISQSLFTYISALNGNLEFWTSVHFSASYASLILISVHIGFHWKSMIIAFKKMFDLREENKARTLVVRFFAMILVVLGIKFSISKQVGEIIVTPFLPSKLVETQTYIQATTVIESQTYMATQTTANDSITLEEFLGKMICTLCNKRCSLLNPRCSKGIRKVREATAQYQAMINESATSTAAATPTSQASSSSTSNSTTVQTSSESASQNNENTTGIAEVLADDNSAFTFIPIMSVYIAGSHYLVSLSNKRKSKNNE